MNHKSLALLAIIAVGAVGAASPALAGNPLGAYIGAGVGASNVGNNYGNGGYGCGGYYGCYGGGYGTNVVAWKVMAGIRPISIVGAELEYMDFGSSNGDNGYYGSYYYANPNSHPKATFLYGVGYLPLPVPFLDVYGKLGAAQLQTNISGFTFPSSCPSCNPFPYQTDVTNTKFAYGAGVQWRWQDFGFRAEYEGISSNYGNPAAVTVGVTWTF